jgi:hypothetical protein
VKINLGAATVLTIALGLGSLYLVQILGYQPPPPSPLICANSSECAVIGVDEREQCGHAKNAAVGAVTPARDATSKTHDGYACLCMASECRWADKEAQNCQNTGGHYSPRDACPVCPPNAACEACFVGCQCPAGKTFDKIKGCL